MSIVRDNTDYQSRVEEHDEELDEIMRKYKAAVQQVNILHLYNYTIPVQQVNILDLYNR